MCGLSGVCVCATMACVFDVLLLCVRRWRVSLAEHIVYATYRAWRIRLGSARSYARPAAPRAGARGPMVVRPLRRCAHAPAQTQTQG
jgi:hypothetical protein